jgi:hypothetical protein
MLKGELKAEEYRARAQEASAAAAEATLDRIRERHQQAAITWSELADAEEARAQRNRALLQSCAGSRRDAASRNTR